MLPGISCCFLILGVAANMRSYFRVQSVSFGLFEDLAVSRIHRSVWIVDLLLGERVERFLYAIRYARYEAHNNVTCVSFVLICTVRRVVCLLCSFDYVFDWGWFEFAGRAPYHRCGPCLLAHRTHYFTFANHSHIVCALI